MCCWFSHHRVFVVMVRRRRKNTNYECNCTVIHSPSQHRNWCYPGSPKVCGGVEVVRKSQQLPTCVPGVCPLEVSLISLHFSKGSHRLFLSVRFKKKLLTKFCWKISLRKSCLAFAIRVGLILIRGKEGLCLEFFPKSDY